MTVTSDGTNDCVVIIDSNDAVQMANEETDRALG